MAERLPFVQLELAGTVGLDEARYLAREPGERIERVLVVRIRNASPPTRRRLRRRRPREAQPGSGPATTPVTRLTVVRAATLGTGEEASAWLEALRADADAAAAEIAAAAALINRAISAQRAASLDPHLADVSAERAEVVRIGYGAGESLADGRWERAVEIPRDERRRRAAVLRPQETIAAVLAGRESVPPATTILLRARADLEARRLREAALELRAGLEALRAELNPGAADLTALSERAAMTAEAANEALGGDPQPARAAELAETLTLCEGALRRRDRGG